MHLHEYPVDKGIQGESQDRPLPHKHLLNALDGALVANEGLVDCRVVFLELLLSEDSLLRGGTAFRSHLCKLSNSRN